MTSPVLPLDPATTAPGSRAAAAPKARDPFILPDRRPAVPGARRASPARPEASAFGQARAEVRSTGRREQREPDRSQRPDESRASDRPRPEEKPRPERSSGDDTPVRESGHVGDSDAPECAGEKKADAEPGAGAVETTALDASDEECDSVEQETAGLDPAIVEVSGDSEAQGTQAAGSITDIPPPTGCDAEPASEGATTASPAPASPAPTPATGVPASATAEAGLEASVETAASPQAGIDKDALSSGPPASGKGNPKDAGRPAENAPESVSPGGGLRPDTLPSAQALTHAAEPAQERGIQTAILATSAPGAASGATRPPAGAEAPGPASPPVPLGAVSIEIGLKSLAGLNRFEIRLDPAELGRIDVRLEIDDGGEVKAHLTVDRVETLALLQRDARTLERAFEQAGLKPSEGGIDLALRDPTGDPHGRGARDERRGADAAAPIRDGNDQRAEAQDAAAAAPRPLRWRSGIDVRV